jgi:hypothetical protein
LLVLVFVALPEAAAEWPYSADTVVERLVNRPETAQDPRTIELRPRSAAR